MICKRFGNTVGIFVRNFARIRHFMKLQLLIPGSGKNKRAPEKGN